MINLFIISVTILLTLTEGLCAPVELPVPVRVLVPVRVKDATGASFDLDCPPERIISLAPSITESLYLLGVGERIVGLTIFCDTPPQAKEKEKVGTLLQVNAEKIVSLHPDLVLATKEGNRPRTVEKLRRLGVSVFVFGSTERFLDIKEHFLILGKIVGKEREARALLDGVEKQIDEIKEKLRDLPQVKVFWQVGADPLVTVARGTFADELIGLAGGINIAHQSKVRYPRYSREAVISENPEVILLVTMGTDLTKHEEAKWQRFLTVEAVKRGRIHRLDPNLVCRTSPSAFAKGLNEAAKLLHPEAFERER